MKDVAELSGVSIKTVSRVLNNEPHVQDALRERVRKAVKELNYVPSQSARALRGRKSYNITLVCHSGGSTYISALQFGAIIACQALGYQLSLFFSEDLLEKPASEVRDEFKALILAHRPDGIMLVAPYAGNSKIADALDELKIPVVRVGPIPIENTGVVVEIDDFEAAIELTEHLLNLGHRRIGFIRGFENQQATIIRYDGYCAALKSAGIEVDPALVCKGQFDFQSGVDAGDKLLSMNNPPTAIFAANDDMAAGVVTAANKMGINVPTELSVIGFDDSDIAVRMWPALTTVKQPLRKLGEIAIEKLVESFGKNTPKTRQKIILDYEFIQRSSTGPV